MTLSELLEQIDGFLWRQERAWEQTAWAVAHLMNVSGKSVRTKLTAKKLLAGPDSMMEERAQFDELLRRWEKSVKRKAQAN